MAKRKKRDPKDPTTSMDPVTPEEAKEAEESFDADQQAEIANLLDEAPNDLPPAGTDEPLAEGELEEKPSDVPAEQEQESQPEAEDSLKADEAKAEEQPLEEPEIKADVPESKTKTEEQPTGPEYLSGDRYQDYTVEVITEDGAKSVPMENLVITYQKYPTIQRRYQELKPVMDLAQKAQVNVKDVLPLLELGIQTYAKQQGIVQGSQPPVDGAVYPQSVQPSGIPGQYQGPFKDAETDEYYKEADPELHASMHRNFQIAQNVMSKMSSIESEMNRIRSERQAPAESQGPSEEETHKAFDNKIKSWSGDHTDYFTAANIGEVRLNAFKNFIIKSHANSGLKIKDLTPDFLQAEFARFDPKYNLSYMQKLAAKKANDAKQDSGMFAEGSGTRTQAVPLNDQQQHMEDML